MVPVAIVGPTGLTRGFVRAILDPAADDTVFPLDTAWKIGVRLWPDSGHRVRWRGQLHALHFGGVELVLADDATQYRWPAIVAFSPARIGYPILGNSGCLQYFDVRFLGTDLIAELVPNLSYSGIVP